jgi:APA family basic amino acid/polyamine antiporter
MHWVNVKPSAKDTEAILVASTSSPGPSLARRLGLFDVTMLVMGTVIGIGIFATPHTVAALVRSPVLVLGAWLVGGLVALAGSLVYAELTCRRPQVGGQYAFLREAYHPVVGFAYGWALLWVVQSGGMASVAVAFSHYFLQLVDFAGRSFLNRQGGLDFMAHALINFAQYRGASAVVAAVAIGGLTLINCTGVRAASTTQNIFMTLKILAILMLVVCGLALVQSRQPIVDIHRLGPVPVTLNWPLMVAFGAALVQVFFSYGGWHTATFMAAEVREPQRTLPRGLVLGVAGVMVLYVAVNFACLRALGVDQLALTEHPASDVMRLAMGDLGAMLISAGITISALGFLTQGMLTSPRVYYAMASDGLFFQSVARIHPRTQVPVVAIVLQGLFATVIALSGTFAQIVNYVMSVDLTFWSLTALTLFIIRRRDARAAEPPKISIPGHPLTTLLFVLVNLAVLGSLFYNDPRNSGIGLAIAAAAVPVYFFWRWWNPLSEARRSAKN